MHDLRVAGEGRRTDAFGFVLQTFQHVAGDVDETTLPRVGNRAHENQVAETLEKIGREPSRIVPRVDDLVDRAEQRRTVTDGQGVDGFVDQCDVGDAEQRQRARIRDALGPGACQQLIEHAERVTRRPTAGTNDQRIHRILDRNGFLRRDLLEQTAHGRRRKQSERVVVRPGPNGRQHLLRLGGREDEDQMLRRLLDDLQQGVEASRRDHVRLVDDEDDVARLGRGVHGLVSEITSVVDASVAGRVHLDDVEVARPTRGESDTRTADAARRRRGPFGAVERPRENTRGRRLTAATRAREEVCVVDPTCVECDAQRLGDVLLPDDLGERRWTVLPVESHAQKGTGEHRHRHSWPTRPRATHFFFAAAFAAFLNSRTSRSDFSSTTSAIDRRDPSSPYAPAAVRQPSGVTPICLPRSARKIRAF
ncbi:hypothetical protein RhoFasB10_04504 [Rhodococcus sp. B10]|nr:hypothetical protein [Rhodococcus sp. B10]